MKRNVKRIIGSIILVGVILGAISLIGNIINWLCADMGRYGLGLVIMGYVAYRMIKKEFGE